MRIKVAKPEETETAMTLDASVARDTALQAIAQLNQVFVQREQAIECIWLALLTGQNFLLVGDPGTAKTALVTAAYSHVEGARSFATLCGSFATEDKMFGPVDIQGFKEGRWGRVTTNRLADCELAFLDEMLKSNDGTLNGMLTALNERRYEGQPIPLWTCGAATNWPEVKSRSDNVAALWDRMLLRCHVREVEGKEARTRLLEAVDAVARYQPEHRLTMGQLVAARDSIRTVTIDEAVRASLLDVEERLEAQGIKNSSRRIGALQAVLRAKAWLRGGDRVTLDDFDVLELGLWNDAGHMGPLSEILKTVDQQVVQECITAIVDAIRKCSQCRQVQDMPAAIQNATDTSIAIKEKLAKRGARQAGRARIGTEIEKLRTAYTNLKQQVIPHLAVSKSL